VVNGPSKGHSDRATGLSKLESDAARWRSGLIQGMGLNQALALLTALKHPGNAVGQKIPVTQY
jgi:hypothetical protein